MGFVIFTVIGFLLLSIIGGALLWAFSVLCTFVSALVGGQDSLRR